MRYECAMSSLNINYEYKAEYRLRTGAQNDTNIKHADAKIIRIIDHGTFRLANLKSSWTAIAIYLLPMPPSSSQERTQIPIVTHHPPSLMGR